jgi:hypothetical protein
VPDPEPSGEGLSLCPDAFRRHIMATALARRFKVDVSADGTTWVPLKGINDLNPAISPTLVGSDDYDTNGWGSFEKTMQGWILTIKALRKTVAGVFDAGQELVVVA